MELYSLKLQRFDLQSCDIEVIGTWQSIWNVWFRLVKLPTDRDANTEEKSHRPYDRVVVMGVFNGIEYDPESGINRRPMRP